MKQDATVISIRDFRANTGNWFDRANSGELILINHHGKESDCYLISQDHFEDSKISTVLSLRAEKQELEETLSAVRWVADCATEDKNKAQKQAEEYATRIKLLLCLVVAVLIAVWVV